ncbi:MAG: GGDEF domain-containing protein [Acidobacteriota bacterium]
MTADTLAEPDATQDGPWWRRWVQWLWAKPDPDLVHAGQRGEWAIAGLRLLLLLLVLYFPLAEYLRSTAEQRSQLVVTIAVAVAALAEALLLYSAAKRSMGRGWIGFFSGILDVSLVTLALLIFLRLGRPLDAVNDVLIFPVYFLAIGATSLRYDWRISILAGTSAIVQYFALVRYAVWQWDLDRPDLAPEMAAEFSWTLQLGRLALLALATALATTLVVRAREQRTLSNRDRLTNLANRGFFDESMNRIGALASRSGEPVAVAMIDVDHFKKFNDTYGHLAGDAALCAVARLLGTSFRTTDLVARYGGEEFAGLFPGMSLEDATHRLEDLRERIREMAIRVDPNRSAKVTVSIGVAVWPQDGVDLSEALGLADLRLYRAKTLGRDRVIASSDKDAHHIDDSAAKTV